MITGNFSNSAAQFLLVGACSCAHSISCFQDNLNVLKAFTLKVLKCPNKKKYFFWVTSISVKFFCSFSEANQATLPHRAPSELWQGSWIHSCLFSIMEVRLSRCLATFHPERLLRKSINCSILHRFALVMPTLPLLPEESQNHHVLRALILSSQIFHIYNIYSAVWLFHVTIIFLW